MFVMAKTIWVWTPLTESLHPDRKSGTPIWEMYRYLAPQSWLDKGYIEEAQSIQSKLPLGACDV